MRQGAASPSSSCPSPTTGSPWWSTPRPPGSTAITTAELKTILGARGAGQGRALVAGARRLARPRAAPLRRRRRLGHLRLLHPGDRRQGRRQPRRLHVERRRQRAGAGHRRRRAGARLHALRLLRREQAGAQARARRRRQGRQRRRPHPAQRRDREGRHLPAAVAPGVHLRLAPRRSIGRRWPASSSSTSPRAAPSPKKSATCRSATAATSWSPPTYKARTPGSVFEHGGSQVGLTIEQLLARESK